MPAPGESSDEIVGVPIALWGLWYLVWGQEAETRLSFENLATSIGYVADGFAADGAVRGKSALAKEAGFKTAKLGFGKTGLAKMEYVDALGQRTRIAFGSSKRNPSFAKGTFVYAPAKGVDVIGG